jgi:ABC-type oligopeptide transport system ATPase subunit
MGTGAPETLLEVKDLRVWFPVRSGVFARTVGHVKAVDGVSFSLNRSETLGIVGESGSGKSTIARVVAGLQRPTAGSFTLHGRVGMVFQDPLGSLNPRMTVRSAFTEVLRNCNDISTSIVEVLHSVGMDEGALEKYPHEFSGGERQRICIARALLRKPDLLICDEAVSALDLSIRSTVLDLLSELRKKHSFGLMFITHDMGVVNNIADRVIVMNAGKIVEEGATDEVLQNPQEAYTRYLMDAVPRIGKVLN